MADEGWIRAFLALDHPETVGGAIVAEQERLKRQVRGDIRWVRPEGIHLTLKFFGDIPLTDVDRIAAAVGPAATATAPFSLRLSGVGVFPDLRRPRVLWLGLKGEIERLLIFQREVERALEEIGFPSEERPFRPHLTLARMKPGGPRGITGLDKAFSRGRTGADEMGEPFLSEGLSLMQSILTPQGAIYTRLREIPLAGRQGGRT